MKDVKTSRKLTEGGLMLALASILSLLKLFELPYGGSITFASMLPIVIYSYRYGFGWGLLEGVAFGLIQMLFGLNNLSYATSALAVVAIIFLDYLFAFTSCVLGALFRGAENGGADLALGALCACAVRYVFHVISGCTVWAGLSIPTADALLYSLSYNATYMIPETIVTVVAGSFLGSALNFRSRDLAAKQRSKAAKGGFFGWLAGIAALAGVTVLACMVFPHLQNAESGEFDITGLANVNGTAALIVAGATVVLVIAFLIAKRAAAKKL